MQGDRGEISPRTVVRALEGGEWYAVPREWTADVASIPQCRWANDGSPIVHRSVLNALRARFPTLPDLSPVADLQARGLIDAMTKPFGWKLRDYQHAGREFVRSRRGSILAFQMRLGKAQPLDARVLTPSGWRRMGDLVVGDVVVDPDGGTARVEAVYPQGIKPVYRVTFNDGAATECCDEHLWTVRTSEGKWRDGDWRTLPLRDLRDRLWISTPSRSWGRGNRRFFVPLTQPVVFDDGDGDARPIAPYLLGALLGDGGLSDGSVRFSSVDQEVIDRVAKLLPPPVRLVHKSGPDYALTVENGGRSRPNPLLDDLRRLGLMGHTSPDKFIPTGYLRASVDDRLALLRGLMDTDGDCTEDRITSFNTTSAQLRDGVLELVRSLGGFASVGVKQPTYVYDGERRDGLVSYRLHIRLPVNPFYLRRKATRWKRGRLARGFDSVERVGDKACRCISVTSKRGLYVTDDYIVTHNTPTVVASHDLDEGPLIVIGPLATRHVWNEWFRRRWPDVEPVNVTGRRYDADAVIGAKIVFGHYDILSSWQSIAARLKPALLVFDEAHVLSQPKSRRTQAALTISTFADRVVAATGTPLWNKPAGLWPMLACLNPGAWGKFYDYAVRYCSGRPGSHGMVHGDPSHVDEFHARMADVMLHLTWNDVADELPPTLRNIIHAPVHETDAYEIELQAERVRDESALRTPIGELARFRRLVGHLKVKPTIKRAVELLRLGESVVVWTWHRDLAQAITDGINTEFSTGSGPAATAIDGDTPAKAREIAFEYARTVTPSALVMTMGVGQVGIDLSHARYEIFAELDFTPATVAQAEMRTFSPARSMTVEYVVLDHVVDRRLAEILVEKCKTAQRMGVPAAESAIDMLGSAFALDDEGDMDRLMAAVLGANSDDAEQRRRL
ncbi:MAG: hypothetical protein JSV86_10450 [Gemmatimonadota bacterium]|nr:MAG: hypothetical protein JSV86_10450 [Gemmatimonadota bacterium]